MTADRIWFAQDLADRLNRSVAQIRWMEHTGTGPKSAILGGRRCWRESDVEAWISAAFAEAS
jgi:predicted DNA-binding transcriptional regulator AlpA